MASTRVSRTLRPMLRGHFERLVEISALEDVETGDLQRRIGNRPLTHHHLASPNADGLRLVGRREVGNDDLLAGPDDCDHLPTVLAFRFLLRRLSCQPAGCSRRRPRAVDLPLPPGLRLL